jgi:hypothetical protein
MIVRKFFGYCKDKQYSPNELLVLFCIKHGINCPVSYVNEDYEVRRLIINGLLEDNARILTKKGLSVFEDITKIVEKEVPALTIDEEFAKEYLQLFPKMLLPSNKPARVSPKIIVKNLTWFVKTYPMYSKETILKATQYYVSKYATDDYKFMRNSQYFISKEQTNRMIFSSLAEFCQLIEDGIEDNEPKEFKTKVL